MIFESIPVLTFLPSRERVSEIFNFRTGFMELLRLRAARLRGNRNWMWFDVKYGWKFIWMIAAPQWLFVVILYILTPVWRRTDERYHLRYG